MNAGSDSITGFRLGRDGRLAPLSGSTRQLSGAGVAAGQVAFSPDGHVLVVTEKATSKITTFQVDRDGLPGTAQVQDSNGQTPFGFAFGKRDQLFVPEAFGGAPNASATSSYEVDAEGVLTTISASVATNQTAHCWVVTTVASPMSREHRQRIDFWLQHRLRRTNRAARRRRSYGCHGRRLRPDRLGADRQRKVSLQLEQRCQHNRRVPGAVRRVSHGLALRVGSAVGRERACGALTFLLVLRIEPRRRASCSQDTGFSPQHPGGLCRNP